MLNSTCCYCFLLLLVILIFKNVLLIWIPVCVFEGELEEEEIGLGVG